MTRTHDSDLAGALKERARYTPKTEYRLHEFVPRRGIAGNYLLCNRCGQRKEDGAHPQPTKKEVIQRQREVIDRIISNAEQDFQSLENNVADISDEFKYNTLTKSQKQRLESLKNDIAYLLDTGEWPC